MRARTEVILENVDAPVAVGFSEKKHLVGAMCFVV
jgi:hypothetical protein